MAKDGTNRGGKRPGAGRKPKSLADKIKDGELAKKLMEPADMEAADMPPISEYLTDEQRDGSTLCAKQVYEDTYKWLRSLKCEKLVSRTLLEQYAMTVGRWIHCEQTISKLGYIAKHPTTEAPIASPYVKMAQDYNRQAMTLGAEIYQIVRENSATEVVGGPQDDVMELLLRARRGK